jgi:dolichyl-phosphate beta-glucosyltransferase
MSDNQPDISLIFPAYNEADRIRETVSEACTYFDERGLSYQIIVAADGDDGTREIISDMAQANPRLSGNRQCRAARQGLRAAAGHPTLHRQDHRL